MLEEGVANALLDERPLAPGANEENKQVHTEGRGICSRSEEFLQLIVAGVKNSYHLETDRPLSALHSLSGY